MSVAENIFTVQMRVDADGEERALIWVRSQDDDTIIEADLCEADLIDFIQALREVRAAMVWHRAAWKKTDGRTAHLARKGADRVLCGTPHPSYADGWYFTPYFGNIDPSHICQRCAAIYQKAQGEAPDAE